ncbi:MAG: GGDEF domain-containing response regulator [Sulfuricurvum sp.]
MTSNDQEVILIIDDQPSTIQELAELFAHDYHVKVATNGKRGLELSMQDPHPDLILLDIQMPNMDGYEVLKCLKNDEQTAQIPVVFLTSKDSVEDEEYGLSLGADDYIIKPIRSAIVKARVKTHIAHKRQHDLLAYIATHDQLTGLCNRHFMCKVFEEKIAHAIRHHEALSVIMMDIDYFKEVNDRFGHLVGDTVLQSVAEVMRKNTRQEDTAVRFGGEEFVLILNECALENALIKAESIRKEIELLQPNGINITASFGVVQLSDLVNTYDDLLKCADSALYQAKENGRNTVVAG